MSSSRAAPKMSASRDYRNFRRDRRAHRRRSSRRPTPPPRRKAQAADESASETWGPPRKTVWFHPNIGIPWRYCKRCRMVSQPPAAVTFGSRVDLDRVILFRSSPRKRGPDRDSRLDSGLRGNERWALAGDLSLLKLPKNSMVSVVFPVRPGLGHRQGALALLLVGAPPRRCQPARCDRASNPRVALDRVSRGTRGDLFARDRMRVARAMTVAPMHQIDVDMVVVMDVRAGCQHCAELTAGRGLHVAQETLFLRQAAPAVLHRDPTPVGEGECRDVERVAEGVLGNARPRIAIHAATCIGGELSD